MTYRVGDKVRLTRQMGNLPAGHLLTVSAVDSDGTVIATHAEGNTILLRDPSMRIELIAREPMFPREFFLAALFVAGCLAFGLWRLIF